MRSAPRRSARLFCKFLWCALSLAGKPISALTNGQPKHSFAIPEHSSLLRIRCTSAISKLAEDTVYKKARLRELPSVKVGRSMRFDLKALERFVEQNTIETLD